jgi:hypothetical protein
MQDLDARAKAEQLHLQAGQRYIKINAHIKVYCTLNAETEQLARNGIEFIEAALKLVPDSPSYLNTYGLLVADGLGDKKLGLEILQRAAQLAPDDIQIRQNIRDLQIGRSIPRASSCGAVPVVLFGHFAPACELRAWRLGAVSHTWDRDHDRCGAWRGRRLRGFSSIYELLGEIMLKNCLTNR